MKTRFFLSLIALVFASGILFISLSNATTAFSTGGNSFSEKTLSFGNILPNHVLYPVLMAVDRVQLEAAPPNERIFKQVEYAHRRLDYAEQLLNMGKEDLAVTTITKAEKYLYNAVQESQQLNSPESVTQRLEKAIEFHTKRIKELAPQFTDANRSIIDRSLAENDALLEVLK
jgi:hypothetical protein